MVYTVDTRWHSKRKDLVRAPVTEHRLRLKAQCEQLFPGVAVHGKGHHGESFQGSDTMVLLISFTVKSTDGKNI